MTDRRKDTPATGDDGTRSGLGPAGAARPAPSSRDARLKAALKANIARRKARAQGMVGAQALDDPASPDTDRSEAHSPKPDLPEKD